MTTTPQSNHLVQTGLTHSEKNRTVDTSHSSLIKNNNLGAIWEESACPTQLPCSAALFSEIRKPVCKFSENILFRPFISLNDTPDSSMLMTYRGDLILYLTMAEHNLAMRSQIWSALTSAFPRTSILCKACPFKWVWRFRKPSIHPLLSLISSYLPLRPSIIVSARSVTPKGVNGVMFAA